MAVLIQLYNYLHFFSRRRQCEDQRLSRRIIGGLFDHWNVI